MRPLKASIVVLSDNVDGGAMCDAASLSRALHDPLSSRLINIGLAIALATTTWIGFVG